MCSLYGFSIVDAAHLQSDLTLPSDIAINLFASTAVISRASTSLEQGLSSGDHEV